ncbi:MAG TPA: M48 family metallopeptidase [Caproiciproducens sp.]|nr:M48 family metallopeptidase [Caproiciproducens sp.]
MIKKNPTQNLDISFDAYVRERQKQSGAHMDAGVPDYAYASDYIIRQKIKAMPGVYPFFKAVTSQLVPVMKQETNLSALKVGPSQFPEIYKMTEDCARLLGIGIPTVFVKQEIGEFNAYAIAFDDESPAIILNSSAVERLSSDELRTIIGHECGHIHNNHGIFNTAASIILGTALNSIPLTQQIIQLLSTPLRLMFAAWSRAAEVTCDRAGMICANDPEDSARAFAKVLGGALLTNREVNIDAVLKQYDSMRATPVRLLELEYDHPTTVRRIFALKEFQNSEVLYRWRPEWREPGKKLLTKQELDARCEKFVNVIDSKKGRPGK